MLLPANPYPIDLASGTKVAPTHTYRLNFDEKTISGRVDGLDAMVQAVRKILCTERFAWVIYTQFYGVSIENLIGANQEFVLAVLEQRIREALLVDDRITGYSDHTAVAGGRERSALIVTGNVHTVFGTITIREELRI